MDSSEVIRNQHDGSARAEAYSRPAETDALPHDSCSVAELREQSSEHPAVPRNGASNSPGRDRAAASTVGKSANGERLKQIYAPVREELKDVESLLQAEMQSPYEAVAGVLRHGVQLGGKRLRPAIHLLIAKALGRVTPANVVIGTVVEMVHTATLIHDDVLDGAVTRRHVATINATWNNHTSILLGDYLFAQSFRLAATLDDTRTCKWVGEASRRVCEGELRQVLGRDDIGLDEETYFQIIRGKTAELCTVACSLAAAEAGCDEDVIESLAGYGENLGIAFQIADDFLDLWGDDSTVGKTLGTDLEQGKLTLPLIRLLETYRAADRQEILKILRGPAEDRWQRLRLPLQRSDAKQYTAKMAKQFKDQALLSLRPLPESPAKDSLRQIAEFSVERGF